MAKLTLLVLATLLASCSTPPRSGKSYTVIDRTEKCMLRLIEKNGVKPTEAEQVCSRIHRRHLTIIEKK
jgi:hypothetical protein